MELAGFVTTKLTLVLVASMTLKEVVFTIGSFFDVSAAQIAQEMNRAVMKLAAMTIARRLLPSCLGLFP